MRTLIALALLSSTAHGALMNSPQPAPAWMQVRLTPLSGWRANTPQPDGTYIGFHALYYHSFDDPTADSFWIQRPTDNIVRTIALNQREGQDLIHDFAPEFAAGLDVVTATMGPMVGARRQFTYSAPGWSRVVLLNSMGVPEPSSLAILAGIACSPFFRRRRQGGTRHARRNYARRA